MFNFAVSKIPNLNWFNYLENADESYPLKCKKYTYNGIDYNIVSYDKKNVKDYTNVRDARTLIYNCNDKLVCIGPSKNISFQDNCIDCEELKTCHYENFVEGTMINMFYDYASDVWEIATKSTIGGDVSFFRTSSINQTKTFREMFFDCIRFLDIDMNSFNRRYCYSFVMQHPDNKIVTNFIYPNIVLIEFYEINVEQEIFKYYPSPELHDHGDHFTDDQVQLLQKLSNKVRKFNSDYINNINNSKENHTIMGVIIRTSKGTTFRIRNKNFEDARILRGNQPKLEYHYLELRKSGKIKQYLQYFPEHRTIMNSYQGKVHDFTNILYSNYISCYIKKEKKLGLYEKEYRQHMYEIHQIYLNKLKPENKAINFKVVTEYVNNMKTDYLMYSINYKFREKKEDNNDNNDNDNQTLNN